MTIGRMALLAVLIEALTVSVLVVAVALFGPPDPEAAQAFAEQVGYWLGPIAGFILCFIGGWLVARRLASGHVTRGLLLGALVAAIDIALLVATGAGFRPMFAVSNLGRLVAGSLGGLVAGKLAQQTAGPKT